MENKKIDISIVIITLARETLYRTLESIFAQETNKSIEVILILGGTLNKEKIHKLNKKKIPVTIISSPDYWGFGRCRNEGTKAAQGTVIVSIDDDEWTKDKNWLSLLTQPIFDNQYSVTTSGYQIPLSGKYWTDCISLLGYPGGGALGFPLLWHVTTTSETTHVCSGNMAYSKNIKIKFNEKLKYGAEDTDFGIQLINKKIPIKYIPEATVGHITRSGFISFIHWHIRRGRSVYEFKKNTSITKKLVSERNRSIKNMFLNVLLKKHFLGVSFLFALQLCATSLGYFIAKRNTK